MGGVNSTFLGLQASSEMKLPVALATSKIASQHLFKALTFKMIFFVFTFKEQIFFVFSTIKFVTTTFSKTHPSLSD